MSPVENASTTGDQQLERERNQDPAGGRFTAVNGTGARVSQVTSFRPESAPFPAEHRQQSFASEAGSLHQAPEMEARSDSMSDNGEKSRMLDLRHREPAGQQHGLGKRKRSPSSTSPMSPDSAEYSSLPPRRLETLEPSIQPPPSAQDLAETHSYVAYGVPQDQRWTRIPDEDEDDSNLAEALQRDALVAQAQEYSKTSGSPRSSSVNMTQGDGKSSPQQSSTPNGSKRPQVRKRNFSQRTKTGCHTCRERKKKCDEAKPTCNNCARGNFQCKGYGPKTDFDLKPSKPATLQAKALQRPERPEIPPYPTSYRPPSRPNESWFDGPPSSYPSYDRSRPPTHDSHPLFPYPSWPRLGSEHEQEPGQSHDHQAPSTYSRASFSNAADNASRYSGFAPTVITNSSNGDSSLHSRSTAQTSLSLMPIPPPPPPTAPGFVYVNHKANMLVGKPFMHYTDPELLEDRDACRLTLERFNNACRPSAGASSEERGRLFMKIVRPERFMKLQRACNPVGNCGSRVIVNSPFTCEYGYNIHLGHDVVIESGCYMQDACKISIGDRTIVGPNVKFYGLTAPMDPTVRNGSQGLLISGSITIEEDCFIGGNVTILPNRTIRKGSIVGAGTVVSKDVQANTIVAGSPMRVLRGIGPNPTDDSHKPHIQAENDLAITAMVAERKRRQMSEDR